MSGISDVWAGNPPIFLTDTDIGPSFLTPDQVMWRSQRQRYGGTDDPNTASYHLSQIRFDKETGAASFATTDAGGDGWYGGTMPTHCDCGGGDGCGCG